MSDAIALEVALDAEKVQRVFDHLGAELAKKELTQLSLGAAQLYAGALRRSIVRLLKKDPTGTTARSVRVELVTKTGDEITAIAAAHTPYANIQDQGGTIEAKDKLLAVPWDIVPRGKGPRDYAPNFLKAVPRPGKPTLLVENRKRRKGEKIPTPYFTLKERIVIEGVHFVDAADEESAAEVVEFVDEHIEELLAREVKG